MERSVLSLLRAAALALVATGIVGSRLLASDPIAQNPPSTTPPNVDGKTADKASKNLDVKKSANVKVVKMWRKNPNGEWMLVWSIPDNINGGYVITGQSTKITRITNSDDSKFDAGTEVVVEIEVADDAGNSTSVVGMSFNNNT